jgi:hypothetical protein
VGPVDRRPLGCASLAALLHRTRVELFRRGCFRAPIAPKFLDLVAQVCGVFVTFFVDGGSQIVLKFDQLVLALAGIGRPPLGKLPDMLRLAMNVLQ